MTTVAASGASGAPSVPSTASTTTPSTNGRSARRRWGQQPVVFFVYDVVVIALLLAVALISSVEAPNWPTFRMEWPQLAFERVIPLWVPWAGALGGVTISLVGVTKYAGTWKPALRWWHISRPLLGAVSGTFAVLLLVFVLQSIVPDATASGYSVRGTAVLTGIAFVVGYREETFRELVKRAADLLLKPAAAPQEADKKADELV
jgi:RsiW-degrading membrane proteinase PrsW (M82 family)